MAYQTFFDRLSKQVRRFRTAEPGHVVMTFALATVPIMGFVGSAVDYSRANSAKADYGASYTLQCVLIAVLGGIDPNGGFGAITGVTFAILILQFLSSGLNMFNQVSNFYRDVIWGGVLILVLVFNRLFSARAERRGLRKRTIT